MAAVTTNSITAPPPPSTTTRTSTDGQTTEYESLSHILACYQEGRHFEKVNFYGVITFIQSKPPPPPGSVRGKKE